MGARTLATVTRVVSQPPTTLATATAWPTKTAVTATDEFFHRTRDYNK